jgi:sugar lactone lactonase YvrE
MPVAGQLSSTPEGVLASGSDGYLYVATGSSVAVVNPSTHQVMKRISVPAGPVTSVAVSPDGSKLYVSVGAIELLTYSLATDAEVASSAMTDLTSAAGNLFATSGGVWGTTGVGMTELAWFAPDADLTRMVRLGAGVGAGLDSIPTFSGGTVWIGGSRTLECASPVTGQVLASATIPTDGGVVSNVGSVTVTDGRTYAYYQNLRAQQAGVTTLTPPSACSS